MINKIDKNAERKIRAARVRNKVNGTSERPRLSVHRTLNQIYCQVIDDSKGITLVSASTMDKAVAEKISGKSKQESAYIVGETIAKLAIKKGIKAVVFDRAGYIYTGRVKALADGARNGGLDF